MKDAGRRTRVIDDHMFEIRHQSGARHGTCRLQLFTARGLRPVAVATCAEGDGCSLTNCAEKFAIEAWRCHLPHEKQPPIWIQRQVLDDDEFDDSGYQVVAFKSDGPFNLSSPTWRRIAADDVHELVGTNVDPSRGEGFEPPPQPVQRVRYHAMELLELPRPHPFREPRCMPEGVPTLLQRLVRQMVRWFRGRCCWYHGGDWDEVSNIAIRLVGEAQASGIEDDAIETFVIVRAKADGVTGWELEALHSLVVPTIGIFVERDGSDLVYVNGQHPAQAMIDAGVRRTLTVEYWDEMPP
jgi:hypothetical protein